MKKDKKLDKTHLISEMIKQYDNNKNNNEVEKYEQFNISLKVDSQTSLYLKSLFLLCDEKEDVEYCLNIALKIGTLNILTNYFSDVNSSNNNNEGLIYDSNNDNNK